jgi:hypothetical protein
MKNKISKSRKSRGSVTISTTISPELWIKCQEKSISWAEALRIGVTYILSKSGDEDYNNPLQMERKIESLASRLQDLMLEKQELENQLTLLGFKEK